MTKTSPRILFVCYGGGHIAMILPVMRKLREMAPRAELVLMALTIAGRRARDAGEKPLGYADFLHLRDRERVLAHGRRLVGTAPGSDVPEDETLAYLGINYSELEDTLGVAGAAERFAEQGRRGFYPEAFMRDVVAEIAPDVVVATNSPRSERAARAAACALGVPCLALNDLLPVQAGEFVGRGFWPDRLCVLSQSVADFLVREGAPSERVLVTGNPAFDTMMSDKTQDAARAVLRARGWERLKPILFSGDVDFLEQGEAQYTQVYQIVDVLEAYVKARPDTALILRYHPSRWMNMKRPEPHPRIHFAVTPEEPPHPQILASDVAVVQESTIALEASIAGKPLISLEKLDGRVPVTSWEDEGVSKGCHTLNALPGLLDEALDGKSDQDRPFKTDGRAAFRIGETILSLT